MGAAALFSPSVLETPILSGLRNVGIRSPSGQYIISKTVTVTPKLNFIRVALISPLSQTLSLSQTHEFVFQVSESPRINTVACYRPTGQIQIFQDVETQVYLGVPNFCTSPYFRQKTPNSIFSRFSRVGLLAPTGERAGASRLGCARVRPTFGTQLD